MLNRFHSHKDTIVGLAAMQAALDDHDFQCVIDALAKQVVRDGASFECDDNILTAFGHMVRLRYGGNGYALWFNTARNILANYCRMRDGEPQYNQRMQYTLRD